MSLYLPNAYHTQKIIDPTVFKAEGDHYSCDGQLTRKVEHTEGDMKKLVDIVEATPVEYVHLSGENYDAKIIVLEESDLILLKIGDQARVDCFTCGSRAKPYKLSPNSKNTTREEQQFLTDKLPLSAFKEYLHRRGAGLEGRVTFRNHLMLDMKGIEEYLLNDPLRLNALLGYVLGELVPGSKPIAKGTHQFEPYGISAVVSADNGKQIIINPYHTWPKAEEADDGKSGAILLSVITNFDMDFTEAIDLYRFALDPKRIDWKVLHRGPEEYHA